MAFAFKGDLHGKQTGDAIYLGVEDLRRCWNYAALEQGWAYPTFYSKLYVDLRKEMARASINARVDRVGLWAKDVTYEGFTLAEESDLVDAAYIVPKLWRRLTSYIEFNDGDIDLSGFDAWLAREDDRLMVLPDGQKTGFDQVVEIQGKVIRLKRELESLVWDEK